MAEFPHWKEIEHQIKILENTGSWPNETAPQWAKQCADEYRLMTGGTHIIQLGLCEIIRQLKLGAAAPSLPSQPDHEINGTLQDLASCFADDRNPVMSERTREMCRAAYLIIIGLHAEVKRLSGDKVSAAEGEKL